MKQKYWFARSLSRSKNNQEQVENNRSKNQKLIFYNESATKEMSQINQQAKKINDYLFNLKQQNKLQNDVNQVDSESNNQIRCLKHNSVIILYCFTDHKLLCSNCVYGSSQHTKHKVYQAKLMNTRIEQLLPITEKTIKVRCSEINTIRSFFEDIQKKIENLKQERLEVLEKELQQFSALLSIHYQKSKKKINQTFQTAKQDVSCFIQQMKQLSKNMRFQHSLVAVRQLHVQQVMDQLDTITKLIPTRKLGQNLIQTLVNYGKAVVSSFKYGFGGLSK